MASSPDFFGIIDMLILAWNTEEIITPQKEVEKITVTVEKTPNRYYKYYVFCTYADGEYTEWTHSSLDNAQKAARYHREMQYKVNQQILRKQSRTH